MAATTNERTTLLIPCEMFSVKAILAPSEPLTPLERLVLRAIHAGGDTVDTLNMMFAIGLRPMLRLVLDFLDRSLVTFNFSTGQIRVTPVVAERIRTNTLQKIEAGGRSEHKIPLMRELISGT